MAKIAKRNEDASLRRLLFVSWMMFKPHHSDGKDMDKVRKRRNVKP